MLVVWFFDVCELLELRVDVEGGITCMRAESFPCQVQLFVAVNNGSSAKLGKRKLIHAYNDDCGFSFHDLNHC